MDSEKDRRSKLCAFGTPASLHRRFDLADFPRNQVTAQHTFALGSPLHCIHDFET